MLLTATSMAELDFPALMEVYLEGNLENGADRWPGESQWRQLQLAEEAFRDYLRQDFFSVPGAVYCLWQEGNRYVSALRLEPYKDGLLLEALETRPDARRRGYAGMLIREVQSRVAGTLYSHVHKGNAASLAVHRQCGFRRISEIAVYIDGSVNDRCCTLRYTGEGK